MLPLFFLLNVSSPAVWAPPAKIYVRREVFLYTLPCVSDLVRKTNRIFVRFKFRTNDIRVQQKRSQPPDYCRMSRHGHTPRKLPDRPHKLHCASSALRRISASLRLSSSPKQIFDLLGNLVRNLPLHRIFAQLGRNYPNRRFVRISDISPSVNIYLHFSIQNYDITQTKKRERLSAPFHIIIMYIFNRPRRVSRNACNPRRCSIPVRPSPIHTLQTPLRRCR